MPIILAVEPDHKQAARLAAIVRHHVGAELVIGDTTERALDALGPRVPDMVLVPALLSPQDDASLAAALRVIAAAAHVRTLTIPVLASGNQRSASGGLLSRWRRGRAESPETDGCDPAVFAEQITAYLKEAAAERAERDDDAGSRIVAIADRSQPEREPAEVAYPASAFEDLEPTPVDAFAGSETFAAAETHGGAEAFAASETYAGAEALTAAERYAGAETFAAAETFDAGPSSLLAQGEDVDAESPALDLSSELGTLTPDTNDDNLFAGEPFGTYTLPPFDEVQADANASLDASLPIETPVVFEAPMAAQSIVDSPIDVDEPIVLEEPMVFDEPIMLAEPVIFEPPAIFDDPIEMETSLAFQALPVEESPEVVEQAAVLQPMAVEAARAAPPAKIASPVVAKSGAAAEAPVAFERPEVLELVAPVGMAPWRAWPPIEGVPIEVPGIAAAPKADVPDWTELMASLRQDMERRRTQEHRPPATRKLRTKSAKPAVDEWGFFDPEQCGFSALLAKLDEITSASQ